MGTADLTFFFYIQNTDRDEVGITTVARLQAAAGYQRLVAYRRPDGSFSSELDEEAQGDVWLVPNEELYDIIIINTLFVDFSSIYLKLQWGHLLSFFLSNA